MSVVSSSGAGHEAGVLATPPSPVVDPPQGGTPPSAAHVRTQLDLISQWTPRYLFRVWNCERSGGQAGLNTPDRITPLAFRNGHAPLSIHDIPSAQLAVMARSHIIGHTRNRDASMFETPFSSWTQSLAYALQILRRYQLNAWISVLDTEKLPPRNMILHTPALRVIDATAYIEWDMEFLAYGVIDEPTALRSVKGNVFESLCKSSLQTLRLNEERALCSHLDGVAVQAVNTIMQDITALVGEDFALACIAYIRTYPMVTAPKDDARVRRRVARYGPLIRMLAEHYRVPADWRGDHTIMTSAVYDAGFEDVRCAIGFMRELVGAQGRA